MGPATVAGGRVATWRNEGEGQRDAARLRLQVLQLTVPVAVLLIIEPRQYVSYEEDTGEEKQGLTIEGGWQPEGGNGTKNEIRRTRRERGIREISRMTHETVYVVESSWWPWVESDLSSIDDSVSTPNRSRREG